MKSAVIQIQILIYQSTSVQSNVQRIKLKPVAAASVSHSAAVGGSVVGVVGLL